MLNQFVLPILTYGSKTWPLTKYNNMHKIGVAQRVMDHALLGISLLNHIPNAAIWRCTKAVDVCMRIARMKYRWTGHLVRRDDGRLQKGGQEMLDGIEADHPSDF